jgi:pectin methylesterase-like acyl-CoA thioesterase
MKSKPTAVVSFLAFPSNYMNKSAFPSRNIVSLLLSLACFALATPSRAATAYWTPGGTDTNWSTGGNWIGGAGPAGVPGPTDSVVFGPAGTNTAAFVTSNYVDGVSGNFGGTVGSLQYTNTAGFHNTLIAPGVSLMVTNATVAIAAVQAAGNAFMVGGATAGTSGVATISGPGASLVVSNTAGQFLVSQSGTAATLNLTNLDTLVADVSRLGVGVPPNYGWGVIPQVEGGALQLARTNYISTSFSMAPGVASSYTNWAGYNYVAGHEIQEAIEVGNGADNSIGAASSVLLGLTNGFYIDSMGVGKSKSSGAAAVLKFNPAFTNQSPTACFRGTNGSASGRVAFLSVGDNATGGSSSSGANGTLDFTGGSVDAMVDLMFLGIDKNANSSTSALNQGVLTFTSGNINVNSLTAGAQESSTAANNEACVGTVNVSGAGATLTVNNVLELGHTTIGAPTGTAPARTLGVLNVTNGNAYINNVIVGNLSTNNSILINDGALVVSNTLATNVNGLARLSLSNSTLGLNIPASGLPVSLAQALVTGGSTNVIQVLSVPVFSSYPQQIKLIKYTSLTAAGFNFGFGATTLPSSAPNAYLSNNVAGSSVDLVLPDDPRPVIANPPSGYSGNLGDNVNFTVAINPASVTPLFYQWYYYDTGATNAVADELTADGATLSGSTNATLSIANGQANENGNYFVVVTNIYGSATSSVAVLNLSQSCVAPNISGPANQSVIVSNNATFSASVSANPAATISWTRNGLPVDGAASTSLTVNNAQYPGDDQAVYCIIASNACGMQTNSATLSVIWSPVISNQPVSLVVTNTQPASFSVLAGGVPPPGYQWNHNNNPISGASNPTALTSNLVIASASPADDGNYSVTITNAAGTTVSITVTLTVNSASLAIAAASPANGQSGVFYDTPLVITFNQPPSLGTNGKIRIYNTNNSAAPVDTVDVRLGALQARTVGGVALNSYAVLINGNVATVFPHSNVMTFKQSYYVTIDNGAFTDAAGAYFVGLTDTNAWSFSTKPAGPATSTNLLVAADGSGDFVTLQGAIDSVPVNNTTPTAIILRNGTYTEIIRVNTKNNISIIGQDRKQTIVAYPNNNTINPSTAARPSFGFTSASDCSVQNLTITNSTPHGGSQAEALFISNSKRFICLNADLDSFQDTILCNAAGDQEYIQDSHVQGDTDFIWGSGTLYATNCELMSMTSGGHLTQPRTPQGSNGFAFVNCTVDGAGGVTGSDLGRDAANSGNGNNFYGQDAYINCVIDTNAIIAGGWTLGSGTLPGNTAFLRFWEYQSVDTNGNPVNTSSRVAWSTEIDGNTATNGVQNVSAWFSGWTPALSPNVIAQPQNLSVAGGASAQFSVSATGIPAPAYQWKFNGNPVGSNSPAYSIAAANANDAGTYTVDVSNPSGTVTTSSATLQVGNSAPSLNPISDLTVNVGANVTVTPVASDPDVPVQTLTFSDSNAPTNASFDTATGILTWRPEVQQANSTTSVTITVADNGSPVLSASQNFNLIVNPLAQPTISLPIYNGSQFSLSVSGQTGPDYAVQTSSDLITWTTVARFTSPSLPFNYTDNLPTAPALFYRIICGPPLP